MGIARVEGGFNISVSLDSPGRAEWGVWDTAAWQAANTNEEPTPRDTQLCSEDASRGAVGCGSVVLTCNVCGFQVCAPGVRASPRSMNGAEPCRRQPSLRLIDQGVWVVALCCRLRGSPASAVPMLRLFKCWGSKRVSMRSPPAGLPCFNETTTITQQPAVPSFLAIVPFSCCWGCCCDLPAISAAGSFVLLLLYRTKLHRLCAGG